ncbi:MAG: carboxypeptidase regulatory-like domain-containing protein [Opitutaceae bacterium]
MPSLLRRRIRLAGLLLSVAALFPQPLHAGSISGRVRARAATPATDGSGGGNYASRKYKFLEKIDYATLRDFVVNITEIEAPPAAGQPPPQSLVTQRDGAFVPHVLPIVAGTIVEWPNADDVFHNVFCMSETTPFDLGLYKIGDNAKKVVFPKTGRMEVFCSIHTKMNCIVLVLPNPWFARANDAGFYTITNVPAGTYTLRAWHERLPSKTKEIVVPANGEVQVDFLLGLGEP